MDYSQFALSKPGTRKRKKNRTRSKATKEKRAMEIELDKLLSHHVIERDKACVKCGSVKALQSCHILPKGRVPRLRFEPDNLMAMDTACHLYFWHRSPHEAVDWFQQKFPGRYERLQIAASCAPKPDLQLLLTVWRGVTG